MLPVFPSTRGIAGRFLTVHTLAPHAAINANRDFAGQVKRVHYGTDTRMRVSAQAMNRASRDQYRRLCTEQMGARTTRLPEKVANLLTTEHGMESVRAQTLSVYGLLCADLAVDAATPGKTSAALFLNADSAAPDIAQALARLDTSTDAVKDHINKVEEAITQASEDAEKPKKARSKKKLLDKSAFTHKPLADQIRAALAPGACTEIALYGRMITEIPEGDVYSAVQRAHSISVDALQEVQDEFSVKEDWDDFGATNKVGSSYIGTADGDNAVNLASGCLYSYAALDRHQLRRNLAAEIGSEDTEKIAAQAEEHWVSAAVYAFPSSMRSRTSPTLVPALTVVAAYDTAPQSMAACFEDAIPAPATTAGADRICSYMSRLHTAGILPVIAGRAQWLPPQDAPAPTLPDTITWV